jgi:hypothetical protein
VLEAQGGLESYIAAEEMEAESAVPEAAPLAAASYIGREDEAGRRRRRRRRRRGSGHAQVLLTPENQALPERHIFRAASDGRLEATGQTAPPEPSRAIAPIQLRSAAVAVEPPPRSLTLVSEEPKVTRPARRRRADTSVRIAGSIESAPSIGVLPPPPEPKRTTTRKDSTAAKATAVKKATKPPATGAKKKATAKKATTRKVSTRKKKS